MLVVCLRGIICTSRNDRTDFEEVNSCTGMFEQLLLDWTSAVTSRRIQRLWHWTQWASFINPSLRTYTPGCVIVCRKIAPRQWRGQTPDATCGRTGRNSRRVHSSILRSLRHCSNSNRCISASASEAWGSEQPTLNLAERPLVLESRPAESIRRSDIIILYNRWRPHGVTRRGHSCLWSSLKSDVIAWL